MKQYKDRMSGEWFDYGTGPAPWAKPVRHSSLEWRDKPAEQTKQYYHNGGWHDEGTGVYPRAKHGDPFMKWRDRSELQPHTAHYKPSCPKCAKPATAQDELLPCDLGQGSISHSWKQAVIDAKSEPTDTYTAALIERTTPPPVAEIVESEPYQDGSPNPNNTLKWYGNNAENDFPSGAKLYVDAPIAQTEPKTTNVVYPPSVDVRSILLAVVPGDGEGHEVYAKTVEDVVSTLSALQDKLEAAEAVAASNKIDRQAFNQVLLQLEESKRLLKYIYVYLDEKGTDKRSLIQNRIRGFLQ